MNVINEPLYRALKAAFGSVVIHNQGMPMRGKTVLDAITQKKKHSISTYGEYYAVNCPKCGDSRHRLWVNHRYNTEFDGLKVTGKAVCYNEHCEQLVGFFEELNLRLKRYYGLSRFNPQQDIVTDEVYSPKITPLPGFCKSLQHLEPHHLAIKYLKGRHFDIDTLIDDWGIAWCEVSDEFPAASHRIIIPIVSEIGIIGWQARYLGSKNVIAADGTTDLRPDGTPPSKEIPKFYTTPGLKKSHIVFNLQRAKNYPVPIITEGPFDAIKVGKEHGLAIFGTTISEYQQKAIATAYKENNRFAIIALDPDRAGHSSVLQVDAALRKIFKDTLIVTLPHDPGDYVSRCLLWMNLSQLTYKKYGPMHELSLMMDKLARKHMKPYNQHFLRYP